MTRLYRLRSPLHKFAMDDPRVTPDYNRPYAEDDPFVLKMPGSFEPVPGQEPAPPEPAAIVISRRGPGRPPWTAELFRQRWRAAVAAGKLAEPATYEKVADYFENLDGTTGIDPEYLGKLARKHGAG